MVVRFGIAMEAELLAELDALVAKRESTRSEVLRDLVRAEVARSALAASVPAVATLTLVYDHHVRDLSERLTEVQHDLGDQVRCTLHVHLDHDHCLEVIVLRGRSDKLKEVADRLLATKGVKHGALELVARDPRSGRHTGASPPARPPGRGHSHG